MDKRFYDYEKLQEIREGQFTQEQLAKKIRKHPKTISRAETGESASFTLIWEIMTACNHSVKDVIRDNVPA
jgi:transcriptional regulator with XRE-family HTH domain